MTWNFCPHCGHPLDAAAMRWAPQPVSPRREPSETASYDQTKYWKALAAQAAAFPEPPATEDLVAELVRRQPRAPFDLPISSIVHLILDRAVTPAGGALYEGVTSDGRGGSLGDLERLKALGYVVKDGKVKEVEGVPVGVAYSALQYWGGERHHRRWHLQQPVYVNPSRHGDPFFMDERYLAFGAIWRDLNQYGDAMATLIETLRKGFDGVSAGHPLVVDVFWQGTSSSPA